MADPRPYSLRAFDDEVQAQADLARVREEIRTAQAERDQIREAARREGCEQGLEDAREQAARSERLRIAGEVEALGELLRKVAAGVEATRSELVTAGERELVKLALAVAEKIVKAQVASGAPVATENLRRAIELTVRRTQVKALVHPQDLSLIEEYLPRLRRDFSDLGPVTLEPSAAVERGGILLQTPTGSVDATLGTQLAEIERGLLG